MTDKSTSLVLRVCRADFTSYKGFKWPETVGAHVVAEDWIDNSDCGNGLHGWLYGQGDHSCVDYWRDKDAKWLVLEVETSTISMIGGKCKFPEAVIRFIGSKSDAAKFILEHEERAKTVSVIGLAIQVGDFEHVTVGALGTATAGDGGTATAGDGGTATAGNDGTATAGYGGTASAGEKGEIHIKWYDQNSNRYRTEIAYVGEFGIKANTKYQLDENHKFVEVKNDI